MTGVVEVPAWAAVVAAAAVLALLVTVALVVRSARLRRQEVDRALAAASADAAELRAHVASLEERLAPGEQVPARPDDPEYVITRLGDEPREPAPVVPAPVFADIVLRESVIKATSLAAGVRRALSSEVRHRIRFEMKREVKRSRKQRRADLKQARREWEARQREQMEPAS